MIDFDMSKSDFESERAISLLASGSVDDIITHQNLQVFRGTPTISFNNTTDIVLLKTGSFWLPPFSMKFCVPPSGGCRKFGAAGIAMDLLSLAAERLTIMLHKPVNILVKPVFEGGDVLNGSWTGLSGDLARGQLDFAPPQLALSHPRSLVFHYTFPSIFETEQGFLSNPIDAKIPPVHVMMPFQFSVWLAWITSYLIFCTTISLSENLYYHDSRYGAVFINQLYAVPFLKRSQYLWLNNFGTTKFLITFWSFCSLYFGIKFYIAVFVQHSEPNLQFLPPFNNADELAAEILKGKFKFITRHGSAEHLRLTFYSDKNWKKLREALNNKSRLVETQTVAETIELLENVPGHVYATTKLRSKLLMKYNKELVFVSDKSTPLKFAFATKKGSYLRNYFEMVSVDLMQFGFVDHVLKMYRHEEHTAVHYRIEKIEHTENVTVTFRYMIEVFRVFLWCYSGVILWFLMEILYYNADRIRNMTNFVLRAQH